MSGGDGASGSASERINFTGNGKHGAFYEFIARNQSMLTTLESLLRSASYLIPGRFSDSELTAEILYATLNLLRLATDTVLVRGMPNRQVGPGTLRQGAWNGYLAFLRRQSRSFDVLLTFLNVIWTIEVPMEMVVQRILGLGAKMRFVLLLELFKVMARLFVFWKGKWRPVLRNYIPEVVRMTRSENKTKGEEEGEEEEEEECLLTEIKLANNKENEGLRNFLRKHRLDKYVLVPELTISPTKGALERCREVIHILRPLVYASFLVWSFAQKNQNRRPWQWLGWASTLAMDTFAEWPQLMALLAPIKQSREKLSIIERDERHARLIKLFLYLLRNPLYQDATRPFIESVIESLSSWKILRPLMDTAKSYQGLCERVVYYTLGS